MPTAATIAAQTLPMTAPAMVPAGTCRPVCLRLVSTGTRLDVVFWPLDGLLVCLMIALVVAVLACENVSLIDMVPVGRSTPEKLPVRGPGATEASALTPERAGFGAPTVVWALALDWKDSKVSLDLGGLMTL